MLTTQFPGIIDTIVGNRGGVRDALADHGIGVEMQSASSVQTSLTATGMPSDPQVYNGQKFTLRNNALNIGSVANSDAVANVGPCLGKVGCDGRFQRAAFYRRSHPMGGPLVLPVRYQLP